MSELLYPAFTFQLGTPIRPGLATIGKFGESSRPSLACATNGGKVLVHRTKGAASLEAREQDITFLKASSEVTALVAGPIKANSTVDALVIGTATSFLAFDVENGCDLLCLEVSDGVQAMIVGRLGVMVKPLILVGGSSIQGFDGDGKEEFWNVPADRVSSMTLCDLEKDGVNELIVSSDDYEICVFQDGEIVSSVTETGPAVDICPADNHSFAFCLKNGTVGVYQGKRKVWRSKTSKVPTSIVSYDIDSDGVKEVIVGYMDGTIEIRAADSGAIKHSTSLASGVAKLLVSDYKEIGTTQLVAVSVDGEVKGFMRVGLDALKGRNLSGETVEEVTLASLTETKESLLRELSAFKGNVATLKDNGDKGALIPISTRFEVALELNVKKGRVDLLMGTNNDTVVKCVVVYADRIFKGESFVLHPVEPLRAVRVPIEPSKNVAATLKIKALIGYPSSETLNVFESELPLPRFALFHADKQKTVPEPSSGVIFRLAERANRIVQWLKVSFILPDGVGLPDGSISLAFTCLRTNRPLFIKFAQEMNEFQIKTEDMDLAGDLIHDLCAFLGVEELSSKAEFPLEMEKFHLVLRRMEESNQIRQKLSAQIADSSNTIKAILVQAEDARILGNMAAMKRQYAQLYGLNRGLMADYAKRTNNHTQLVESLQAVHAMIQRAAALRLGSASTRVVNECRAAIKGENYATMFKIISLGQAD